MRKLASSIGILLGVCLVGLCQLGRAQVLLNPGDVYNHGFTSLPLMEVRTNSGSLVPLGRLSVVGTSHQWRAGDTVRLNLFEDYLGLTLIESGLITFPLDPGLTTGQAALSAWQDRQGAIRIRAEAGSVTIEKIILEAMIPVDASRTRFNYHRSEFAPESDAVAIEIQRVGSSVRLSWPRGTLVEAGQITGPWTTNLASSPLTVPLNTLQKFYRVRVR